ncbi:MAG: phosphatidate cytidylyltransferase [Balneolales bacterium]|nr:phosphatidate cytidylyltransferase [Balneolales bacterium]
MNEFGRRVIFALFAAPAFLWVAWYGDNYFIALMWLLCMLMHRELLQLIRAQGFRPNYTLTYLVGTGILSASVFPEYAPAILLTSLVLIVAADTLNRFERQLFSLMGTLLATIYPSVTVLSFILIRQSDIDPLVGYGLILAFLLMVWGNDTFAYLGGKSFGKHLMAPHLSPKKTWEGFASGFIGAGIGLWLAMHFGPLDNYSLAELAVLPVIVSIVGPIGDLTISKIKRASGMKDTSTILPGHGGILDRFDSILLVSPVIYIYITYIL